MDEATFEQGFWSWITRSYTIRIGHRFTKESEIRLTHIAGGKDVVAKLHQAYIKAVELSVFFKIKSSLLSLAFTCSVRFAT